MHAADVKSVFRAYSIDVAAREKDDLKEEPIVVRLRKVVTPTCAIDVNELTFPSRPEAPVTTACSAERLHSESLVLLACYYYYTSLGRVTTQYHCHFSLKRTFRLTRLYTNILSYMVIFFKFSIPSSSRRMPNHSSWASAWRHFS